MWDVLFWAVVVVGMGVVCYCYVSAMRMSR